MEFKILNVSSAVRTIPTVTHFTSMGRGNSLQTFPDERIIRSISYSIPAVSLHYGNAFAPEGEEEGEEDDADIEEESINRRVNFGQHIVDDSDGEYYYEEEVDDDVEMSPAVEVISIDPNCDYDSEEEIRCTAEPTPTTDSFVIQHTLEQSSSVVGETVIENDNVIVDMETDVIKGLETDMIENVPRDVHCESSNEDGSDSDSSSSSSGSTRSSSSSSCSDSDSSSSDIESNDHMSSTDIESTTPACSSEAGEASIEHKSADALQKGNVARVLERRKMMAIERSKRRNSTNRKSFSLPQSPVAIVDSNNWAHDATSLSFEDLDVSAIVSELSPLKTTVRACMPDDELIEDLARNNFDLTSYITEDDPTDTKQSSLNGTNVNRKNSETKLSPIKSQPRSRGKQIQMLRELMISPVSSTYDSGGTRRSCTSKSRRIVENTDSETEESESEADSKAVGKMFGVEQLTSKIKRKDDDTKADPTWNPNSNSVKITHKTTVQSQKAPVMATTIVPVTPVKFDKDEIKLQSAPIKTSESSKATNGKTKLPSAGSQLARQRMLSLMSKNNLSRPRSKQKHAVGNSQCETNGKLQRKEKPRTAANIKLDHDYCSPKRKPNINSATSLGPQRKAIEIPFLLPTTKQQFKQKKKLSKSGKKQKNVLDKHSNTGNNCDMKSSQNIKNNGSTQDRINHNPEVTTTIPVLTDVPVKDVKNEPIAASILPLSQKQQSFKQVSLLKINQNKPTGVPTLETTALSEIPKPEMQSVDVTSSTSNESIVKIKRKLNLQEYKKRRELPTDQSTQSISASKSSSDLITDCVTSSKEDLPMAQDTQERKISLLLDETSLLKHTISKTLLDPISAAKLKALRMQQLKKEAVIKSTEANIIPKTVTTMIPLAEITSIKFDEHGNPVPYDKRVENKAAELKLHEDYEEIVIVSMGCNTEISINPKESKREIVKISSSDLPKKKMAKNELLSNITDTIKRCQSSASAIISSNSLISSIHETVIKKKSCETNDLSFVDADKQLVAGGEACQQILPNIGVSPPTAYSPGKPEKAGGSYEQTDYDEIQIKQSRKTNRTIEHGEDKIIMHLRKDRQRAEVNAIAVQTLPLDRFPELKRLSPIKKRERSISCTSCGSTPRCHSSQLSNTNRDRSRRQYRKRHSRSSSIEPTVRNRSADSYRSRSKRSSYRRSRSRSRCRSYRRRSRSRSRSYRRTSSSSRRRRISVSSERRVRYRNSRSRGRRGRRNSSRRRSSRSDSTSHSDTSSSSYSRSRSRSIRSRSSSSRSSSRARVQLRNDIRRTAVSPERKIVYVGRLEASLKRDDLKQKFMHFGRIKQVTLHYKESGAKYGFVTFERPQDAYKAIDASGKDPKLCGYDVNFGGRRAFCRTEYADLGK
ncbi:serine-rich adhesin for platelets isoform X2 [Malaya genurostris]|uniref:serine-rich adhesin for platelets isoform X2 n=1 Tax=Malaya genurostris TaxID=325434 RepID=UPI0026F3E21A|nr:serine-rich adhesin for platelets isoform X2 [Malaya genurostris]